MTQEFADEIGADGFAADVSGVGADGVYSFQCAVVAGGCAAVLRCCEVDHSQVVGGGIITWDEDDCGQVGGRASSFGELKTLFR